MSLTKELVEDKIEILEDGQIQVRTSTRIRENGKIISQTYHRSVVQPGDSLVDMPERIKNVGNLVHTTEVVEQFQKAKEAREKAREARGAASGN